MIRNFCLHRGRAAERFVDAAKVVKREPKRHGRPVVLPLLTESVRQASEPARPHGYAQVLPLNNRGTNSFGVRGAND